VNALFPPLPPVKNLTTYFLNTTLARIEPLPRSGYCTAWVR
jgi:hypothetical protein